MPVPTCTVIQPAAESIQGSTPTVQVILSDTGGGALGIDLATISVVIWRVGESRTLVSGGVVAAGATGFLTANATLGYDVTVRPTTDCADARWFVVVTALNLTADALSSTWAFTAWEEQTPIEDHVTFGSAQRLAQDAETPRVLALIQSFLAEVQNAEDLTYQMLALRSIRTATGVNLDVVGELVGQGRIDPYAANDEIYRLMILVRILVNRSDGRWEQILDILERAGEYEPIGAREYYPATIQTECTVVPSLAYAAAIWSIVKAAKAAGVRWDFLWSTYSETDVFTFSSQLATDETDVARGTANLAGTTGGRFMGLLT